MTSDRDDLKNKLGASLAGLPSGRLGVAVSGGSDSLALLYLAARSCPTGSVVAATVDHGLRPEARQEAAFVADHCAKLGVPHEILNWSDWNGTGNLQSSARDARYRLLAEWAQALDVKAVMLGHTQDDQAETVLMRLGRSAGVDGLCAMEPEISRYEMVFLRPLLSVRRAELQGYLRADACEWTSDPSNEDRAYHRVNLRKSMPQLEALGLTVDALSTVAMNMQSVRRALNSSTENAARAYARVHDGDVLFDKNGFWELSDEIRRRLLVHAMCWVSKTTYAPRQSSVDQIVRMLSAGNDATLHGCVIRQKGGVIVVSREYQRVKHIESLLGEVWDHRWKVSGPKIDGAKIAALGETGLRACPDWRETGVSRQSLLASPAVWQNDVLIAAPLAGFNPEFRAELIYSSDHFHSSVLSH
ncbi:tRNA lysidine(34) synthetase TilS [Cochlodiniinecator piscidefendens]|uniref:tRNA lysidine(34) synthetase TilS n=1 Tax=Cochlodiniinecator piscidefendens TaxID=2715756 RepID=UPI00140B06C1